ncbi:MAG: IclR family transcriptional regulator [Desulfobacterales bacterium]|nr:MAG: IclR family transcriptional regulator [Desulfobacterales bacterium]
MQASFKRVPALEKCFAILELLAKSREPLGVSGIARVLNFNRSTVFNILHTLTHLEILEQGPANKFGFGIKFYMLGRATRMGSELIRTVHSYLQKINQQTKLSAFLGTRSGLKAIIVDKVDDAFDIRISSEIGMELPLLAGAGGKVLLSQLADDELDQILSQNPLQRFTRYTCVDKAQYREMIRKARREGIAVDKEEYLEDIRALAVPLNIKRGNAQFAIWAVGLKRQLPDDRIGRYAAFLKQMAREIEIRLARD